MIKLSNLLQQERDFQVTPQKSFSDLKGDVAATLRAITADRVVLFEKSGYRFLVGLLAALHKGVHLSLPPNDAPKTLEKIEGARLQVKTGGDIETTFTPLNPHESVIDFFTSGSTGEAKSIRKKLIQIENEIEVLEATWGEGLKDKLALATVSHQHIYGMLFKVLWPVCAGRPFYDETFEYWENLVGQLSQDTLVISSPAHLSRYPDLDVKAAPSMVFSSGGPLSLDAAGQTRDILGFTPMEVFGSTETGGIAYRQQTGPEVPWQPFEAVETRQDAMGVLSIRSPYLDQEGWYETSDRVEFVKDRSFVMRGRVDRIVKVEGKRVSLPEVEAVLSALDDVAEACALITNDERKSLSAVVVLSEQGQGKLSEIGEFRLGRDLRQQMKPYLEQAALPRRWRFVSKIPVNSQGKRLLADLLALYEAS